MSDFIIGDANSICDCCGFKFKLSQLRKRWDGAMVCSADWEPRHPQDSIKARPERNNAQNASSEPPIHYVGLNENTAANL